MKKFFSNNFITMIIDLVATLSVIVSFVLECKCFSECSKQIPVYNANIIVSLLPAIVTIISISLQLHDDKIFNTKIRDYQKLRKNHFNLLHMVLITVFIFAIELVVQILNKSITAITISAIAFSYAIIFSTFELPILMKSERSAVRILKSYFARQRHLSQEKSNIFNESVIAVF